jgi:hypothetical protein
VSEFDATRFVECQELHGITIDELDVRELDGNDTALLERHAKDVQVFPCDPPADAQNDTLINRKPIDSAGHARWPVRPPLNGKPGATRHPSKTPQESRV